MGRNKILSEWDVRDMKKRIDLKEISLRAGGRELGVSHEALRKRIKQLPLYKPSNNLPKSVKEMTREEINKSAEKRYKTFDECEQPMATKMATKKVATDKVTVATSKELPFRKMPTAREYSGLNYYQLDIEQLRMFYRLLTGKVDKSKGGKASNIKSIIPAIIGGLKYNLEQYQKRGD